MYAATTLSSAKSISAESLNLRSDSNSEAAHGASESETRVSLRKKRIKQDDLEPVKKCSARETKARKDMCGLPDIEDSPYKKTNGTASSRTRKLNSYIKSTEASPSASSIKTAGFLSRDSTLLLLVAFWVHLFFTENAMSLRCLFRARHTT
jgi:endonuclease-3